MSTSNKRPHAAALAVAEEIEARLKPCCERCCITGSLRRMRPRVGDAEILFIPRMEVQTDPNDLLGGTLLADTAAQCVDALVAEGLLARRVKADGTSAWGAQIKLAVHPASGLGVDLFIAGFHNWWNRLVCTTGPAESNEALCVAAIGYGLRFDPFGEGLYDRTSGRLLFTPDSEEALFRRLNLPYHEPPDR